MTSIVSFRVDSQSSDSSISGNRAELAESRVTFADVFMRQ